MKQTVAMVVPAAVRAMAILLVLEERVVKDITAEGIPPELTIRLEGEEEVAQLEQMEPLVNPVLAEEERRVQ